MRTDASRVRRWCALQSKHCLTPLLLGTSIVGCAETAKQAARTAAPAAAEGTLETARKPENRRDIATIIGDPRIRAASRELAGSVADGVFDTLTDEERLVALQDLSQGLVERLGPALAKMTIRDLRPALTATIAESENHSVAQVFSDENRERLGATAKVVVQFVADAFSQEIGAEMTHWETESNAKAAADIS